MVRYNTSCFDCGNKKCFIKKNCSEVQLKDIDAHKLMGRYAKNQHLFHEGNDSDNIYFVYKGILKVSKKGAFNKDQIVRYCLPGDIMGHRGLNSKGIYPISAQAIVDSVVCQLSKKYFFQLLRETPQLAINLMIFNADELNFEESKLRDMSIFNVREKVAKALLILLDRFGVNEQNELNNIELLSRQDVAECVGLTSNQVTKVLGEFKQDKLIETAGKKISLLNVAVLEEMVSY